MRHQTSIIPMSDDAGRITQRDVTPTALPDEYLQSDAVARLQTFHLPRFNELPVVELYRDQVTRFIEQTLMPLSCCCEGAWLTPSMVNNYVKSGLVAAPRGKLYTREHLAYLLVICVLKQVLSISAIAALIRIQRLSYATEIAYDYIATELENAVRAAFSSEAHSPVDTASTVTRESLLVRRAVSAFVSKAYLTGYLHYIEP